MKDKETVCAVVVTYNRKNLLLECLEALKKQTKPLDAIYIVDNASTDGTPKVLFENKYIKELPPENLDQPWEKEFKVKNLVNGKYIIIHYVRMHENTGGTGGFHEGVKRGYEKGYDWLWLMDDDAEAKEDALGKAMQYKKINEVAVIANLKVGIDGIPQYNHRGWKKIKGINNKVIQIIREKDLKNKILEIDHCSFVGFILKSEYVSVVGLPKKEMFLHFDDVEYSFRIRQYGKILLVTDSIIYHKDQLQLNLINKKFFIRNPKRKNYDSYWLAFYGLRNFVYLKRVYGNFIIAAFSGIINILRSIAGIILFDDNKIKRIKMVIAAYNDGLKEIFDNERPKRILYR